MHIPSDINPEDSPIEYPCTLGVKVVGSALPEFRTKVLEIASRHDPEFNETKLSEKYSKNQKYLSLTLKIHFKDYDQRLALYAELKACELSLWLA